MHHIGGLLYIKSVVLVAVHHHYVGIRTRDAVHKVAFYAFVTYVDYIVIGRGISAREGIASSIANRSLVFVLIVHIIYAVIALDYIGVDCVLAFRGAE